MAISFSTPHEQFLSLRARRGEVLSSNIANADTPNYKARDYDFADALKRASTGTPSVAMKTTKAGHQSNPAMDAHGSKLVYRVPTQPTLDGNTVETDVEQARFAENTLKYRASLRFIDGYIKTMRIAIKGGD
jgi:flagellar basal-body rod protein FlgB